MDIQVLNTIVSVAAGVFGTISLILLIGRLRRWIAPSPGMLDDTVSAVNTASQIAQELNTLYPRSHALKLAVLILMYAQKAVLQAEKRYQANEIPAAQRKVEAVEQVNALLAENGLERHASLQKAICACVEAATSQLPKTHTNITP